MLSGTGLCDVLFTCPEESFRLWCVVCDLETSRMRRTWPALGRSTTGEGEEEEEKKEKKKKRRRRRRRRRRKVLFSHNDKL